MRYAANELFVIRARESKWFITGNHCCCCFFVEQNRSWILVDLYKQACHSKIIVITSWHFQFIHCLSCAIMADLFRVLITYSVRNDLILMRRVRELITHDGGRRRTGVATQNTWTTTITSVYNIWLVVYSFLCYASTHIVYFGEESRDLT